MNYAISTYDIIEETWEVQNKIGQGSFSQIYIAKNIIDENEPYVAMKVSNAAIDKTVIRLEVEVLKSFNVSCVPKYIHHGSHQGSVYVVMELLHGEDMSFLRDRTRLNSGSGLISLHASSYLARQMLQCIRVMHEHGYIHRDIKPANFVRRDKNSTKFSIIDFGITRQHRDRDGTLKPKRAEAEFRGTTTYASPHSHREEELCPRDDLYSLLYVFIDFVCGKLPWTELSRQKTKDKAKVKAMKEGYLDEPERLIEWMVATVNEMRITRIDTCRDYDHNFPEGARQLTLELLLYLKTLEYESIPDYDYMERAFASMVDDTLLPDISDESYEKNGFKWTGAKDKMQILNQQGFDRDIHQRAKIFGIRVRHYYNQHHASPFQSSLSPTTNDVTSSDDTSTMMIFNDINNHHIHKSSLQISQQWKEFASIILQELPIENLSKETIDMMDTILRDNGWFFEIDLGDKDENWSYFTALQKMIYQYQEKSERFRAQKRLRIQG